MTILSPLAAVAIPVADVTAFGAVGDGTTLNTKAIQAAVDDCAKNGGGTVFIPAGTFLCGSVELKSNITLLLGDGSTLRGSGKLEDYPPSPFHHNELGKTRSLLWAIGKAGLRITGQGTIDLNDAPFMDFTRCRLDDGFSSNVPYNERQKQDATAEFLDRPTQPIFFHDCERLRIDGVTVRNSPCWTITASCCRDFKVSNVTVHNNLRVSNCDGIHCCSCRDVIITDSVFHCGDDCIAITGITNWDAISENIVIANCTMASRSAAIRFGHKASKVRNVVVSNIVMNDTNRGIAIFAAKDGWVENVSISNILIRARIFGGGWWGKGEPLVVSATENGRIDGVSVSQVRAKAENGIVLTGEAENVRNIDLRDWDLQLGFGQDRSLFKALFDIAPAKPIPAPDPTQHIPGLYANGIHGLRVANLRTTRANGEPAFSTEPLTEGVSGLEMIGCKFESSKSR